MRTILGVLGLIAATCVNTHVFACGGGYGTAVTIKPSQSIGVVYHAGQESYIFRPHFCGAATEFGLILPVPATLTENPTLASATLFDELEALAAPTVEEVEVCAEHSFGMGGSAKGADMAVGATRNDGVYVVNSGTVGQFQWELLKADSTQSFTQWLDTNHFAYPSGATAAFDHYVQAGWYFVAFRVATGSNAPPSGYQLCGDFGPISLSFQTTKPTVPARIATANDPYASFLWRVFAISNSEQTIASASSLNPTLTFAGPLNTADLQSSPAVASVTNAGDWLTAFNVSFTGYYTDDIAIAQASTNTAFREHQYNYKEVNCGVFGCTIDRSARTVPAVFTLAMVAGLMLVAVRRR